MSAIRSSGNVPKSQCKAHLVLLDKYFKITATLQISSKIPGTIIHQAAVTQLPLEGALPENSILS